MFEKLLRLISSPPPPQKASPPFPTYLGTGLAKGPAARDPVAEIVAYPPVDRGIAVAPVDRVIGAQKEVTQRIFRTAGFEPEMFEAHVTTTIRNLARFVHLLPATATGHHRGTGGLFHFALDVGLHSMQAANAAVFPIPGSIDRRFLMQPKWALATFLAGLCGQLYRTINAMSVLTRDNAQWEPLLTPLYDWAVEQGADVYFVRWREQASSAASVQASSAFVVNQIIPAETLQYLSIDNSQIMPALTSAIAGWDNRGEENPIGRLIAPLVTRIIEKDLKREPSHYGHLSIGVHLERHLIDAMRQLVRLGRWVPNSRTGCLWVGSDGTYLDWPACTNDVVDILTRQGFVGFPRDPETLADVLVQSDVFQRPPGGQKSYWTITTPSASEARDSVLKLVRRDLVFPDGYDFNQFNTVTLLMSNVQAPPAPKPPAVQAVSPPAVVGEAIPESTPAAAPGKRAKKPPKPQQLNLDSVPPAGSSPGEVSKQGAPAAGPGSDVVEPASDHVEPPQAAGADVTSSEVVPSEMRARLLGSLTKDSALLLHAVLEVYDSGRSPEAFLVLSQGMGIDDSVILCHGMSAANLMREMAEKKWLWVDITKPMRSIHRWPSESGDSGTDRRVVILKGDVACGLGMAWSGGE